MKLFSFQLYEIKKSIIIFYVVGAIGMSVPFLLPYFILLIPYVLLFHFALVVAYHSKKSFSHSLITLAVFITIFLAGMAVEIVGVQTGKIFGSYSYGDGLGVHFMSVPVLIGINWMFMVYASASFANMFRVPQWMRVFIGAGIMVLYDLILEQVAPVMDMWEFSGNTVPVQNYSMWFVCALFFHALVRISRVQIQNPVVRLVFVCHAVFFLCISCVHTYIL
jgi:putative membrane protein